MTRSAHNPSTRPGQSSVDGEAGLLRADGMCGIHHLAWSVFPQKRSCDQVPEWTLRLFHHSTRRGVRSTSCGVPVRPPAGNQAHHHQHPRPQPPFAASSMLWHRPGERTRNIDILRTMYTARKAALSQTRIPPACSPAMHRPWFASHRIASAAWRSSDLHVSVLGLDLISSPFPRARWAFSQLRAPLPFSHPLQPQERVSGESRFGKGALAGRTRANYRPAQACGDAVKKRACCGG